MTGEKKREVSAATLVAGQSVAQFVIEQLLKGLKVQITIDETTYEGYVYQLDFATGGKYVIAIVSVPDSTSQDEDDTVDVKVAIFTNGKVEVISDQLEN